MTNTAAEKLKENGNEKFKNSDFVAAKALYSEALQSCKDEKLKTTLYCNRAACNIKLNEYNLCIEDCNAALSIEPTSTKSLFRKATAYEKLENFQSCYVELTKLLRFEPKNNDAIKMMRRIKEKISSQHSDSSEVNKILQGVNANEALTIDGLKSLIGLCCDDKYHSIDFGRKNGITWLCDLVNNNLLILTNDGNEVDISNENNNNNINNNNKDNTNTNEKISTEKNNLNSISLDIIIQSLRLLSALSIHKEFVDNYIDINTTIDIFDTQKNTIFKEIKLIEVINNTNNNNNQKMVSFISICSLATFSNLFIIRHCLVLIMTILKNIPFYYENTNKNLNKNLNINIQEKTEVTEKKLFLSNYTSYCIFYTFLQLLQKNISNFEIFNLLIDSINALLSDNKYFFFELENNTEPRYETTEQRKTRVSETTILKTRSQNHAKISIEIGILDYLILNLNSEINYIRQNSSNCVGKIIHYFDDDEKIKKYLQKYIYGAEFPATNNNNNNNNKNYNNNKHNNKKNEIYSDRVEEIFSESDDDDENNIIINNNNNNNKKKNQKHNIKTTTITNSNTSKIENFKKRASLEASILVSKPELGTWMLSQLDGIHQLSQLVSTNDTSCQEIAAEV
jgi:hypothetical protein